MPVRWIAPAGPVLIALLVGVPAAAADTTGSVIGAPPPPSLPSLQPPAAPPVPVETSPAPAAPVPAPRAAPVRAPTAQGPGTTPSSSYVVAPSGNSGRASSPGVGSLSVDGVAGGTMESAATGTGTTKGAQRSGSTGSGSGGHRSTRAIGADSVKSAQAAPLRRFLAYVWPAIALGPTGPAGTLLEVLLMQPAAANFASILDSPRLLLAATGVADAARVGGLVHSDGPTPAPGDSRGLGIPDGGEISLFVLLLTCVALMALLLFTLRRELRAMHRWL